MTNHRGRLGFLPTSSVYISTFMPLHASPPTVIRVRSIFSVQLEKSRENCRDEHAYNLQERGDDSFVLSYRPKEMITKDVSGDDRSGMLLQYVRIKLLSIATIPYLHLAKWAKLLRLIIFSAQI